jgi:hypothetical protein
MKDVNSGFGLFAAAIGRTSTKEQPFAFAEGRNRQCRHKKA